jgi:hypothetical protein
MKHAIASSKSSKPRQVKLLTLLKPNGLYESQGNSEGSSLYPFRNTKLAQVFVNTMLKKLAYFAILLITLSGCTTPVTPDFSAMSAKYANILEQYQINMIFQNIIRASQNRPVSFLDMPNINGSGSISVSPSVNGIFAGGVFPASAIYQSIGGGLNSVTPGASASFGNTFNFAQSSLDNATFWKGFLTEIQPDIVKYFMYDQIPKEVLFSVVVQEIIIVRPNGEVITFQNNPTRVNYPQFQEHLYKLIDMGLGAYLIKTSRKAGPLLQPKISKIYLAKILWDYSRNHILN